MPLLLLLAGDQQMAVYQQTLSYRDDRGQVGKLKFYVEGADAQAAAENADALRLLITPLTNAAYQSAHGPLYADNQFAYGANADFETIEDKLRLQGKTVLNRNWAMEIPAPKEAMFLADGETADFANVALAAFIAAAASNDGAGLCDKGGDRLHTIYGGIRTRRKMRRRFSLTTKNPQLTGPGL